MWKHIQTFSITSTFCLSEWIIAHMYEAHLDQNSSAQFGFDQRLGHPASSVRCRPVHLREVFTRESSSTMSAPAPVCVHDDLPARYTSVTLMPTRGGGYFFFKHYFSKLRLRLWEIWTWGPPMTNRPLGWRWQMVLSSRYFAGTTALITWQTQEE